MQQENTGGPGYLDLALVKEGGSASWSSLKGEWHRVKLRRVWSGEQHIVNFGNAVNGSFMLEYGFSDVEGYPRISQTHNITLNAQTDTVEWESWRVGVHVSVQKSGALSMFLELAWCIPGTRPFDKVLSRCMTPSSPLPNYYYLGVLHGRVSLAARECRSPSACVLTIASLACSGNRRQLNLDV